MTNGIRFTAHIQLGKCLLVLPLAGAIVVAGCDLPKTAAPPQPWITFECQEGGFTIRFPKQPSYKTSSDGREHRYTAQYMEGRRLLRVAYEDDFDSSIHLEDRLAAVRELPNVRDFLGPTPVTIGRLKGLEASYVMGSMNMIHRVYHAGRRSYQLIAVMEQGEALAEADVTRCFTSFKLLDAERTKN